MKHHHEPGLNHGLGSINNGVEGNGVQGSIHFAGTWDIAEQKTVAHAVETHEAALDAAKEADAVEPWVCLRVTIDGASHYLGYRLGEEHVLKATAAGALALEIEARAEEHLSGNGIPENGTQRGGLPTYRLRKVIDYVRANLDGPVTVAQMADQARMSESHFARLFKRSLGLTPIQYLAQCRVEQAQRLLRSTDLKIAEVARRVGLRSASHFAEVFRKRTGMTPRMYRNRYRM